MIIQNLKKHGVVNTLKLIHLNVNLITPVHLKK